MSIVLLELLLRSRGKLRINGPLKRRRLVLYTLLSSNCIVYHVVHLLLLLSEHLIVLQAPDQFADNDAVAIFIRAVECDSFC